MSKSGFQIQVDMQVWNAIWNVNLKCNVKCKVEMQIWSANLKHSLNKLCIFFQDFWAGGIFIWNANLKCNLSELCTFFKDFGAGGNRDQRPGGITPSVGGESPRATQDNQFLWKSKDPLSRAYWGKKNTIPGRTKNVYFFWPGIRPRCRETLN